MVLLGMGLRGRQDRIEKLETEIQSARAECDEKPEAEPAPKTAGMLGACLEDLDKARVMIKAKAPVCPPCPAPGEPPQGQESAAGTKSSAEDPGMAGKSSSDEEEKMAKLATVQSMFIGKLGLSDPEFGKLKLLVCAFKALRASILADLSDGSRGADQAWSEMAAMRKELADETQALLGEERYAGFRAVGGIGALGENVDCTSP